jgi:hypothetical protein
MNREHSVAAIDSFVGHELGVSDWVLVEHARIDAFAARTGERQWIHVDVERAKRQGPFGGTIAHGHEQRHSEGWESQVSSTRRSRAHWSTGNAASR